MNRTSLDRWLLPVVALSMLGGLVWLAGVGRADKPAEPVGVFAQDVRPLLKQHCLSCHSTKTKKGDLDLERFASLADVRQDLRVWQSVLEQLETGEMPPKKSPQPTADERKRLETWVRSFLDSEVRSRAGDPGRVPLRRLSNAEYDCTIRDLAGVDLRPTRDFPVDGAAGEGFTNAAEALSEISPTLLGKYLNAAKQIADHAVLLPDGFRFSAGATRRDWTDESVAQLRKFYAPYGSDGRLHVQPYIGATLRNREALKDGKITIEAVAAKEKLDPKYLGVLWKALTDPTPSQPLDAIRERWRQASDKEAAALTADITAKQKELWKFSKIGSYVHSPGPPNPPVWNEVRQWPNDPANLDKAAIQGRDEFRQVFPWYICFPAVVPTDEVVCLKMYHREDEPLARLFLDDAQKRTIDRLWEEHRFISRQPIAENDYLPQFIGFTTQDAPKEIMNFFKAQPENFRKRAEEFEKEVAAAIPKQIDALLDFASRAYRRPLTDKEKTELRALYQTIREKGTYHSEAFHGVLARIFVSPAFLFRVEVPPSGKQAGPVNDWEIATRLSYFLWSSVPDEELRQLAAAGKLKDPKTLTEQAQRMIRNERVRSLAIEFGTQWIHVRGFDELKEKNEKLFPTFDEKLRKAIYEESILFFQDLFQNDRSVTSILNSDATFLNDLLAKHYGIPNVSGPQWRRVEGVRKHGRGGILGLASVQAKQSGASRTSPVLRGNWVVETLLGEKLPRPPANVPQLPEMEGADKLTTRQLVEKHASVQECAVCHVRIDPFGFSLERYDPIGRRRDKEVSGLPVDAHAKLKDGTEFDDLDGLRTYLLTKKKDVIVRLFCRKLLGYSLGRATTLSDQSLIDEMAREMDQNDGRLSAAVLTIVRSPQFRMVRGAATAIDD
jgi:mono/diheme cytochrome c family protein